MDLVDVYEAVNDDPRYAHFRKAGKKLVWGRGNNATPVAIVVGEAPGATEELRGKPFVGASGRLLDGLMGLARIDPSEVWITNAVKYRPTDEHNKNRTPDHDEIMAATAHLRGEWKAVGRPPLMITCGGVPLKAIIRDNPGAMKNRVGEPMHFGPMVLVPMYHPAYPLRNRALIPTVEQQWTDLGTIVQLARDVKKGLAKWPKEFSRRTG